MGIPRESRSWASLTTAPSFSFPRSPSPSPATRWACPRTASKARQVGGSGDRCEAHRYVLCLYYYQHAFCDDLIIFHQQFSSASAESSGANSPSTPLSPATGRAPKRINGSLLAAMGGFDPSKPAPGMRPRPSVSGDTSPLLGLSPLTPHSPNPMLLGGGAGVAQGSFSPRSGDSMDDSQHSLHSVSTDSSLGVHNNNLDRPLAKNRRAPTKKKFETKVEDLPPVPVVPIAVTSSSAASGKSKGGIGSAWKAIFGKSNKSQTSATSNTNTNDDAGSVSDSGLALPHVLEDAVPDPSPVTPKTPGKISGLFSSLGLSKKVSKKQATPQSAPLTPSNISGK